MQLRTRTWSLLSLLFFAGAAYFWLKGNQIESDKQRHRDSERRLPAGESTNAAAKPQSQAALKTTPPAVASSVTNKPGRFPYRLSNTTKSVSQLARSEEAILLRNALIDGAGKALEIPEHLRAKGEPGAYIVQSKTAPSAAFREHLNAAGAEIVSYIPNNAYLVTASSAAAKSLQDLSEVRSVLPFEPYYKLDQRLLETAVKQQSLAENTLLRVTIYPGNDPLAQTELESLGGFVLNKERSPFGAQYLLRVPSDSLVVFAQSSHVQSIEPYRLRAPANDLTRVQVGISSNTTTTTNYLDLSGTNIVININDTGVDKTHLDFTAANLIAPDPAFLVDNNGHGTHVAGILAGSGARSKTVTKTPDGSVTNASFRGMAPSSKLLVLPINFSPDVEDHVTDTYLQETAALLNEDQLNRTNKTLISNNSWNYIGASEYDSAAARYDAAVRDALPERTGSQAIMYVFPAGNGGFGSDDGLNGEPDSIYSPGTAKNVITVGALEHIRNITAELVTTNVSGTGTNQVTTYITNMPFLSMTDKSDEVAPYSGRGNVGIGTEGDFGRFKPDVVAPGTFIISAKSTKFGLTNVLSTNSPAFPLISNLNSTLGEYRYESGTTFAAPVVSGLLALIEEFFEQKLPATRRHTLTPAMMKAILINGTHSVNQIYDLQVQNTINIQGWGLPNIQQIIPSMMASAAETAWPVRLIDQSPTNAVATGQARSWNVKLSSNALTAPLRITLVWTDPPGNPNAGIKLVNDLDLVVTNVETGLVFYGNNIPPESDFTRSSDTNSPPENDFVNNVENVFISDPQSLGTNYIVSVVGRRVNVNAISDYLTISGRTNDVVQDFALVISSANGLATNAFTLSTATSNFFNPRIVTTITNGLPLVNQRLGANASLVVTNGITNQWNFYVFTNTYITNDLFSITNGTNVAFATFLPPTLSRPRNFEADIDMYVSSDARLLNLDPIVLSAAATRRSLGRTGSELVVYSNAAPNQVFYVAIKSEDQQGAEFGFITISTNDPFETQSGNNRVLRLFPANRFVPDGSANRPSAAIGIAIGITPAIIEKATVRTTIAHEDLGDLIGTLYHNRDFVVLNNHTLNDGFFTGTNTFFYNDSGQLDIGEQRTDGPGSLNNFTSDLSSGPWIFQLVDNSPTHTGRLQDMVITILPMLGGDLSKAGNQTFTLDAKTTNITFFLDVPPNATNLTISLYGTNGTSSAEIDNLRILIQKDLVPTFLPKNYLTNSSNPVTGLVQLRLPKPPLGPGRYFIKVEKIIQNGTSVKFGIDSKLDLEFTPDLFANFSSAGSMDILQDARTNSIYTVTADREVAKVEVGVRIDHPRISDLVLHLVSPQGTRVLLAENRGGSSASGYGSGAGNDLAYTVFTENTNLTTTPIKFAVPPFGSTNAVLAYVLTNSFDRIPGGTYPQGTNVDGWTVVGNDLTIAAGTGFAPDGANFASLCDSGVSRTFTTIPGREYNLRFLSRAPIRLALSSTLGS